MVQLEKLCMLWVKSRISNLDYLLHLNILAGRRAHDPQAHFIVPWVTDFTSRCGKNWRDLSKSKYRLAKGDRQLDMTYDVITKDSNCPDQIAHHVSDPLSDITYYVYMARRVCKELLCKHVRNKWVPAEYPASVQRIQEWTPDECIPEFYTDPSIFKSVHEDLPDLGIPSWATCVEDFITKHREALESTHVSENLHHWIDLTFGYKLSGSASIKAKNVCLSLVDGHMTMRRGASMQLFTAPHPAKTTRLHPPAPPRLHWMTSRDTRKSAKANASSEDISDEEEESTSLPQHVSRLNIPTQRVRSRHKSYSRTRSQSKVMTSEDTPISSSSESRASSNSRHYRVQKSELGKGVIYLPKEYNPIASILSLEALDNFRIKCFFSKPGNVKEKQKDNIMSVNLYPMQDLRRGSISGSTKPEGSADDNAFTNHMFLASYDQNYLRRFSHDTHLESVLKERRNRSFNNRYTTDISVYKQFVTESRKQDMIVIGCLIIEIFLHNYLRPLRATNDSFTERYNCCRTVLKYNYHMLPKCMSYIAGLLLNVQSPYLSFKQELSVKPIVDNESKKTVITDKGLPSPTSSQMLQPLLMQHLIPFPQNFKVLYNLLVTLHEYELTSRELNILCMYECDGIHCETYQSIDKNKLYFSQRLAEGKIRACISHLDVLLNQLSNNNQFDILDIFLPYYIELLENKTTCVLAAWYLFDTCFLDNFTQHLVEAVGGYKDANTPLVSPGHICQNKNVASKKPRYSDDTVKNALNTSSDIFSPDTSFGSELVITPNVDKIVEATDSNKDRDGDNRSENELFHFETDRQEILPCRSSRSKSPADSVESYSLNVAQDVGGQNMTPSPTCEAISPQSAKEFNMQLLNLKKDTCDTGSFPDINVPSTSKGIVSPTIDIPKSSMFTSYLHFADEDDALVKEDVDLRKIPHTRNTSKSLELGRNFQNIMTTASKSYNEEDIGQPIDFTSTSVPAKISDMSVESLIWLSYRLGPVLTCRYVTRNLLKMLTLCYIGKENLMPLENDICKDEFDKISIANSKVIGDQNAMKVIKCLTSIVAMYGEQLILLQYLPHMGELIASCRKRLSAPLEGGVVACLQLLKYLLPLMSDVKVMEQLQDTFLKSILHPTLRLLSTTRCAFPNGVEARAALARKFLDVLHVLAVRIGPEMTRKHLFFLTFDKASGKTENWPKTETDTGAEHNSEQLKEDSKTEGFLEICRDGTTAEWTVKDGRVVREDVPDLSCSPPDTEQADGNRLTAQEELLLVFNEDLANRAYQPFLRFVGLDALERSLKNSDTIYSLRQKYNRAQATSSPYNLTPEKKVQTSFSDDPISRRSVEIGQSNVKSDVVMDHISSSNSFGSNVTLVGNRIDVVTDTLPDINSQCNALEVVSYKSDDGVRSDRHVKGDWLIYWEHEVGRPDKENRFNLKQIKLQQFTGHTHTIKSIYCLDNENSFMSGSKDKTVRLWSLRNQGDGGATSQCNWAYTGHKKGVLSLAFLESLRLAVSTDSVVHIWDPFMESVVSQLDNIKSSVSIVRTLPSPSRVVVAATTDAMLKLIDARAANYTHDLKLVGATNTFIRCMCVAPSGRWIACGFASGHVAVIEPRTGTPLAQWRAHDGEVLRLTAADDARLLSSGLDQVTAVWSPNDGELIAHLKHDMDVEEGETFSRRTVTCDEI
ncbi:WD repeat-containing protein 81 [Eumeta japonica]|uniref:WD repeat-containing protein 81 n=1 Tax=Eumeta variegata TaxID=151549 RepID=A0A4C1YGI5_EUMVA|nr:WD repeat-containing protein 81 [Eumeta japonica]